MFSSRRNPNPTGSRRAQLELTGCSFSPSRRGFCSLSRFRRHSARRRDIERIAQERRHAAGTPLPAASQKVDPPCRWRGSSAPLPLFSSSPFFYIITTTCFLIKSRRGLRREIIICPVSPKGRHVREAISLMCSPAIYT